MKFKLFIKEHRLLFLIILSFPLMCVLGFGLFEFLSIHSKINGATWLSFCGSIMEYIGTVSLGIYALFQTQKANDDAEKAKRSEENYEQQLLNLYKMQTLEYYPIFTCDNIQAYQREVIKCNELNNGMGIGDNCYIYGVEWSDNRAVHVRYKENSDIGQNGFQFILEFKLHLFTKFPIYKIEINHIQIFDVSILDTKLALNKDFLKSDSNIYCDNENNIVFSLLLYFEKNLYDTHSYLVHISITSLLITNQEFVEEIEIRIDNNKISDFRILSLSPNNE